MAKIRVFRVENFQFDLSEPYWIVSDLVPIRSGPTQAQAQHGSLIFATMTGNLVNG
jgi:hypothetical protein